MRTITRSVLVILLTLFTVQNLSAGIKNNKKGDHQSTASNSGAIVNFDSKGRQITRFDSAAAAIDAHDGEIALFDGVYYLYGTSYDCGYEWGNKTSPFCGFKCYSSRDLVNWADRGFLFDARAAIWQTRCNGSTYGCYRPHVIYNQANKKYVLWINVYDNKVGYRVFTSNSPEGPFAEVANPTLAVNSDAPVAGLNNGDHDTFVDDDGTAYLAYTDWRTQGTIVIEKLSADYLTGTGICVKSVTPGNTEAPAMFKRNGVYYILYSDPNCGYCSGTGTSYRRAANPMGPWSEGMSISANSCGGQPSFVSIIKRGSDVAYLYGSDLWNNGARNEALANYFWAPLSFSSDGSINPVNCQETMTAATHTITKTHQGNTDSTYDLCREGFITVCDIRDSIQRTQSFVAGRSGTLTKITLATFKSGYPNAGLKISVYNTNKLLQPSGDPLSSVVIHADSLGWAPKNISIPQKIQVIAGKAYVIVLNSTSSKGCYGIEYTEHDSPEGSVTTLNSDKGKTIITDKSKKLMFQTFIDN